MIILRNTQLYYISDQPGLEKEVLIPRIPNDFLTRSGFSDRQTKRLVFYPDIDSALMGYSLGDKNLSGQILYIYQPLGIRPENIIKPSITSSPTVMHTNESWVLSPTRLKYIASIKIGSIRKGLTYHYGPRSSTGKLYTWEWNEILKPWEKKTMKLYRKTFASKKHDENWYRGEETDRQKKNRKKLTTGLVVSGAVDGALLGNIAGEAGVYRKASKKVLNARIKDLDQELRAANVTADVANKVRPEDREAFRNLIKKVGKKIEHNKNATGKFGLKAEKIVKKSGRIGALKGAAIGTAIGGGLAYMSNKSIKKANEKSNAARRNRSKNKKDSE